MWILLSLQAVPCENQAKAICMGVLNLGQPACWHQWHLKIGIHFSHPWVQVSYSGGKQSQCTWQVMNLPGFACLPHRSVNPGQPILFWVASKPRPTQLTTTVKCDTWPIQAPTLTQQDSNLNLSYPKHVAATNTERVTEEFPVEMQTHGNTLSGENSNIPDAGKEGRKWSAKLNQVQIYWLSAHTFGPKHAVRDRSVTRSTFITTMRKPGFSPSTCGFSINMPPPHKKSQWRAYLLRKHVNHLSITHRNICHWMRWKVCGARRCTILLCYSTSSLPDSKSVFSDGETSLHK